MSTQNNQPRERPRTPNNRTTTGFQISDELWTVLQPLLPAHVNTHRFGGGRPRVPDRTCADAIFSRLLGPAESFGRWARQNYARIRQRTIGSNLGRSWCLPHVVEGGRRAV